MRLINICASLDLALVCPSLAFTRATPFHFLIIYMHDSSPPRPEVCFHNLPGCRRVALPCACERGDAWIIGDYIVVTCKVCGDGDRDCALKRFLAYPGVYRVSGASGLAIYPESVPQYVVSQLSLGNLQREFFEQRRVLQERWRLARVGFTGVRDSRPTPRPGRSSRFNFQWS